MEKEKILAWLDRLIELNEELHAIKYLDLEGEKGYLMVCTMYQKEIQLFRSIKEICSICGFEMECIDHREESLQENRIQYKGYYFLEMDDDVNDRGEGDEDV